MAGSRSPYAALAALSAELPATQVLTELLRELSEQAGAPARLWRAHRGGLGAALSWPAEAVRVPDVAAPEMLAGRPEVDASALVHDNAMIYGAVTLATDGRPISDDVQQRLARTADCVLVVWRREELRTQLHQQVRHTHRLAGELADSGRRLSTVRDLERRRVATEIITLSTGRLGRLHQQVDRIGTDLATGLVPDGSATAQLSALLDELIEDFRVMVRGIHPQVLATRGARAALAEVVAGLPRPARITGAVPARIDQELGAALYHVTASALQTLAGEPSDPSNQGEPLNVQLSHENERLGVLLTGATQASAAALRAALTVDTDRLAALDGGVEIATEDGVLTLHAWVPDRLEPQSRPPRTGRSSLSDRVRAVALGLAAQYRHGPGYDRAQALVTRLDGPVRLGVADFGAALGAAARAELTLLARRLPDLLFGPYFEDGDPENGDPPDAVLEPAFDHPDRRIDVALLGAGVLVRSAAWPDLPELLATEVLARADLLRARSVLAALAGLLRTDPLTGSAAGWFDYELEELQAGADELAELEALAQLRTGALDLSRIQLRTAERLLGVNGAAPHERLGLPETAAAAELDRAATEQMDPWRRMAENAAAGRQQRQACGVIVRSCERLLTRSAG